MKKSLEDYKEMVVKPQVNSIKTKFSKEEEENE